MREEKQTHTDNKIEEQSQVSSENEKEDYTLYTEKIVESPKVKYKKAIDTARGIGMTLVGVLMLFIVVQFIIPWYSDTFLNKEKTREELTIAKDDYESMSMDGVLSEQESLSLNEQEDPDAIPQENDYENTMAALRARVTEAQKAIVAVDRTGRDVSQLMQEESSETETSALIIGYVNSEYIMITSASAIDDAEEVVVRFSTLEETIGAVRDRNENTDMAVIAVSVSDMSYSMIQSIKVAVLDNSYNVQQGDLTLTAGRLYGQNQAIDYGTITDIAARVSTDNTFEIFNTNLSCQEGDFCFAFNTEGNVIGVSTVSSGKNLKFMGVSDLKAMIESMTNKGGLPYCGIRGQNVTGSMVDQYQLPMGIYISEVEVDSPAYVAGLQASDVIYGINGNSVLTIQVFSEKLYQCSNGQSIQIMVKRQGKDGYHDVRFDVTIRVK